MRTIVAWGEHRALTCRTGRIGPAPRAVEHYARSVELWQHADPELQPQVRAAQRRIASLMPDR